MEIFNINLNIHYSAPKKVWNKLMQLYQEMPNWNGFEDGCHQWYGIDGKLIQVSIEPSGLQFYAELPEEEWQEWISLFKVKATLLLGYAIGEPEEGYDFKYYWEPL